MDQRVDYASRSRERTKTMVASTFGTVLDWYDFNLYGLAAALVFPTLFFPNTTPLIGTLASFATFAVGFFARPIGGILFGHFGDRIGRKTVLIATLLTMGVATTLIGFLPTYSQIGIFAPLLLILLRVVQGIGVGGEFAGATLLTIENAPREKRGFYGAVPAMGTGAGFLVASAVFTGATLLSDKHFLDWGWRIPFLLSSILVATGFVLRRSLHETPLFEAVEEHQQKASMPVIEAIRSYPVAVLRTLGITVSGFVWGYLIQAFVYSYGTTELHIPRATLLTASTIAAALEIVSIPFWGWLSDKLGRKPVILGGLAFMIVYALPFFWLLGTNNPVIITIAMIIAIPIAKDSVFGPQAAIVAELFSTKIRYSGVSVGREIGGAIFGGTAPFIGTALYAAAGQQIWPVAAYVVIGCLITFFTVATAPETAGRELT